MTRTHLACPTQLLNMNTTLPSPLSLSRNPSGDIPPPLAYCFFTHAMSVKRVFAWVFVLNAALAEALASFSGFRSFRILLPRAPSTITQYEYYSPLSPGSVQESLLGCPAPPCVLFFYARDVGVARSESC